MAMKITLMFKAFQNKSIYTFTNTTGKTGGVLYYELGTDKTRFGIKRYYKNLSSRIIRRIYELYFFKPLK